MGEGCVRFLIGEERVAENIRGYVERALGEDGPADRMMLRELDLRAQVIDTLTSRAHTRVSPCLDITSCARGMLRLELTSGRFHWAALQSRPILDQTCLSGIRKALRPIPGDIAGMIDRALERLTLQKQARTRLAMRPLALLTAAQAPLSAGDLGHALVMLDRLDVDGEMVKIGTEEVPDAGAIEECCTGLIAIDLGSGLVTIARGDISQQMRKQWNDLFGPEETVRVARVCMA